jgi:tRNA(Ile)-lysidine synthetase-like protein
MKKIISEINTILSEKIKINPKDICIYGFSGGQDSVLLFIILLHLKKQWNIKIQLLHFHHFWQKKNFFSTDHVWYLSFVFRNPIYIINSEVFLNSEKKARQWRQQGFQRISELENSTKILTGHTASDRIETAIWHLIRGTSPQGLISVKWQTNLLAQTECFSFPKFFLFNSFEAKKLNEMQISSSSEFLKRINRNKYKISKITSIYKKSKNKKTVRRNFSFVLSKEKKKWALIPVSKKEIFGNNQVFLPLFGTLVTNEIQYGARAAFTLRYGIPVAFSSAKAQETAISFGGLATCGLAYWTLVAYATAYWTLVIYALAYWAEKICNLEQGKETRKNLKQYEISCVLLTKLTKKLLIYTINKKKSKRNIYKKNKKKIKPVSFLIFNSSLLNTIFFEKNQKTLYCFSISNFFFSKKNILRPLLVLHRNDVTLFSKKYFLPLICDPSNQKVRWSRNRIRHQLLPVLRFFFNPNIENVLNNFLEINIEEQKYIESIITKIIKYWLNKYQKYYDIKIQLELFPKAIQRRLLQKIFQSYTTLQPNLLQIEILRITINNNF